MNENKNITAIIIVAIIMIGLFYLLNTINYKKEEKVTIGEMSLVKDYNRFYTVSSCVDKYIASINSKNTDDLLIELSNNYIKENIIDENNIYNYINTFNHDKSFLPQKMYYERKNSYISKYYVHGYLSDKNISNGSRSDYYIIVYLDENNMTYEIEPYDGEIFNSGDINES